MAILGHDRNVRRSTAGVHANARQAGWRGGARSASCAQAFDFGPKYDAAQVNARVRRALADIVDAIGLGVAAGAVDADKPDVRKALDGDAGRYLRLDWLIPLLRLASADDRLRVLKLLCGALGYEPVMRAERSVERRLADLEERGEKNPSRKLTETQAMAIRERGAAGEKRRALAREFGVSYLTVHYILTGERWGHLAGATPPRRQHARAT